MAAVEASAGEAIAQLALRGLGVGILSESMTAAPHSIRHDAAAQHPAQ